MSKSKSKPYSRVTVNNVDVEMLTKNNARQPCVVGVDVGKLVLVAVVRWPDGSFLRPWSIANPLELHVFIHKLKELSINGGVTVAMEASGTYGDALRQALGDAGIMLHRVSGKMVKDQAETFDGVASNHDGKDAAIIADLCARGKGTEWNASPGSESDGASQAIRYWVRRLDRMQSMKQMLGGKIEAQVARHWPEVSRLLEAQSATLLRSLIEWGGPAGLAGDPDAGKKLRKLGGTFLSAAKIEAVIAGAKATAGVRINAWEQRELRELAAAMMQYRKDIAECKRQLRKAAAGNEIIRAQIPAVGLVTACVLWTHLGDPRDYHCAGAYRKAMGLNLTEFSSGKFQGQLHISRRGHHLPRKWMFFSAMRLMQHAAVKPWVDRKKQRDGDQSMCAIVGIMRKLALAMWHVGANGVVFEPRLLFPGKRLGKRSGQAPGRQQLGRQQPGRPIAATGAAAGEKKG